MTHKTTSRRGLTLLEVVLALAILVGSYAVLSQLVGVGVKAAANGRDLTRGQLLAESVMSEIVVGILQPQSLSNMQVPTDPGWVVSSLVQPTRYQGIVQVTVIVRRVDDLSGRSEFLLTRWLRDPSLEIPVDEEEEEEDSANTDAAGTTGSAAGGGSQQGNATGGNSGFGGGNAAGNPANNAPGNAPPTPNNAQPAGGGGGRGQ